MTQLSPLNFRNCTDMSRMTTVWAEIENYFVFLCVRFSFMVWLDGNLLFFLLSGIVRMLIFISVVYNLLELSAIFFLSHAVYGLLMCAIHVFCGWWKISDDFTNFHQFSYLNAFRITQITLIDSKKFVQFQVFANSLVERMEGIHIQFYFLMKRKLNVNEN